MQASAGGWFEQSDLTQAWPRRRALLWVLVCVGFFVALVTYAVTNHRLYELLLGLTLLGSGVRTGRRLLKSRSPRQDV